jgi:hypothetical protein
VIYEHTLPPSAVNLQYFGPGVAPDFAGDVRETG